VRNAFSGKSCNDRPASLWFPNRCLGCGPGRVGSSHRFRDFLSPTEGFAPNINVQIQPYTGTIKEYATLSKGQFDELKWKVISEKEIGDDEWSVEYTGTMQAGDLHFYARAISKNGKVYLATATAKESQWPTVSDTLRQHIDSFEVK
jgi:hypothetical protein